MEFSIFANSLRNEWPQPISLHRLACLSNYSSYKMGALGGILTSRNAQPAPGNRSKGNWQEDPISCVLCLSVKVTSFWSVLLSRGYG